MLCETKFNAMKTKLFLIALIGLVIPLSCQKSDSQKNERLSRILLYSSVTSTEPVSILEEYDYDSNNRVSKVSTPSYENGKITGTIKYDSYEYNSKGQLVKIANYNANINSSTGFINLKNYVYTYASDGLKTKELIEYPQINSFEYSLFKYSGSQLIKAENYDSNDKLVTYIKYEYNNSGALIKETTYTAVDIVISVTINNYINGLNTSKEVYSGNQGNKITDIINTYDSKGNLMMTEYNETLFSSQMSRVVKYEYSEY